MSSLPTVLIFTYPECGQANVNLAVSYELALAGVDVHIASFASLGTRIPWLQGLIDRHARHSSGKAVGSVSFHEIKGVTPNWEAQAKCGVTDANLPHPYGVLGAVKGYSKTEATLFFWGREEYLAAIESVKEITATIKPDVVGVDPLFFAAQDACILTSQKFMFISPLGLYEAAADAQPYFAAFWKYPFVSSGFQFPLKWWQVPLNIYLRIQMIIQSIASANVRRIYALRGSLGLGPLFGVKPGVMHICPSLTELDYPFAVIPEEICLCGPIVMPFDSLEECDLGLKKWLDNGPTVFVNQGSHMVSDERVAREMAGAFRILLDHHDRRGGSKKIQILWKAKTDGDVQRVVDEIVGKEIKEGRLKIVAWLDVEPVSVLQHPNVICTVHHGGANSFSEGIWAGVPHVVLAVWLDTYNYALRAEYLNIGIFGNRTCAPGVRAEELGTVLVRVTGDNEEAFNLRTSAKHLMEVCRERGNGRELASAAILKVVKESK